MKNDPSNPLYKSMKILELNNVILFKNCMFVLKKYICKKHPNTFTNFFKLSHNEHNYNTRGPKIIKPTVKTTT